MQTVGTETLYQPSDSLLKPSDPSPSDSWPVATDRPLLNSLCNSIVLPESYGARPVWEAITGPEGGRWVTVTAPWLWREGDALMNILETPECWRAIDGYGAEILTTGTSLAELVGNLTETVAG